MTHPPITSEGKCNPKYTREKPINKTNSNPKIENLIFLMLSAMNKKRATMFCAPPLGNPNEVEYKIPRDGLIVQGRGCSKSSLQ
jgi:hypothetical protein